MCISTQSRSHLNPIQVSRFVSHLHLGSQIHASSLSHLNLTSIWVLIFASRLHPDNISPPSRSTKLHLSSIQASSQSHTGFKMCVSPPSRSFSAGELYLSSIPVPYHPIYVSRCASQLNPGPISTPSRSRDLCLISTQAPRFMFLLCPTWILLQSGSWYLHLTCTQVTSHLHPGPANCILVPPKPHPNPIQVSKCVSHLHPGPFSTGELYLSSILVPYNPVHVSRCASQLNPGPIPTPSRSRDLCLLSTQAPRFTFLLCPTWISPQSGSWYLHIAYIQVTSHLHPGPPNYYVYIMYGSRKGMWKET